ncbi:hypothetical protein D3C78_278900 [compost metagenome]
MTNRLNIYFLTNIYIYSLIYIYINFSHPKYSYLGWQVNENINFLIVLLVASITSSIVFFIKKRIEGPLELLVLVSYLIIYLPSMNLAYICMENNNNVGALFFSYTVSIFILIYISHLDNRVIKLKSLSEDGFKKIFYSLVLLMFLVVFISYKPSLSNFSKLIDFSDVYEIRGEYREANEKLSVFISYFFTWLIKVFIPAVFVIGLLEKSYKKVAISLLMIFSMFLISGHKSIVLGFGLVLIMHLAFKRKKNDTLLIMSYLIYIVVFSLILAFLNYTLLQEIVVRRAMVMPGMLSNMYFNYFKTHDFTLMGQSIFSFLFEYKYDKPPPYLIGDFYFNRTEMSANANYMAAAYGDFGVIGTICITLFCGLYFKLLNIIANSKKIVVTSCMLSIVPMWALLDSAFITVLITHGLIWILIIFILLPKGFLSDKNY